MIKFYYQTKTDKKDLIETINALKNFKNIYIKELSENTIEILMPINLFGNFSHSLEYWGKITLI